uniref:Uncharacterized protein n=1 Tax=Salix viminalis TaxID=40686 RepID=A0A6N2KWQ8_SALVM
MGKVKRESIEPLGTGLVLWQNQSKFQWSDRNANQPGEHLSKSSFASIPIWVKFDNVPLVLWTPEGMEYLGSNIGNPLYLDSTTSTMRVSNFAIICIEIQASFVDTLDGGMITRGCGTSDGGGDFMILEAGFTKLCGNGNADGGGDCTVVDGAFLAFIFSSGTMYCFI